MFSLRLLDDRCLDCSVADNPMDISSESIQMNNILTIEMISSSFQEQMLLSSSSSSSSSTFSSSQFLLFGISAATSHFNRTIWDHSQSTLVPK